MPDIGPCLEYATSIWAERADGILDVLSGPGAFTEFSEWRISTYVNLGIERFDPNDQPNRFRCWSGTDELWEAWVNGGREAVDALALLSWLQMSFFYVLGWPSWASGSSVDLDTPPDWEPEPGRNECESYIAKLWEETRTASAREIDGVETELSAAGLWEMNRWEPDTLTLRAGVKIEAHAPGLQLTTTCPTPRRALEVGLVYREIAADISEALSLGDH